MQGWVTAGWAAVGCLGASSLQERPSEVAMTAAHGQGRQRETEVMLTHIIFSLREKMHLKSSGS